MQLKHLLQFSLYPALILGAPSYTYGIQAEPESGLNKRNQPSSPPVIPGPTFTDVTVFVPPADYIDPKVLYARTVLLEGGVLLATWENYSPPDLGLVYYPIFKSIDGGLTWKHISNVTDQVNGWGMRYQPFLYELKHSIGEYPAGTVLCAGNSIPEDLNYTRIDLYASPDKGYTWHFVSHIAMGGEAIPDDGLTPIWEPFLLTYEGKLVCYYSDQRDPLYGQKLVHQVSADLKTWAPPVDDVVYGTYTDRPGMTTVAHLPNGQWIMTYEFGGGPWAGDPTYSFPVYYRISNSPLTFNSSVGLPIVANGTTPISSPYVVWSPVGGKDGTIAVSCGTLTQIFVNKELGAEGAWEEYVTPQPVAYTRHLRVMDNPDHLLIMGAGVLPPAINNTVTLSVIDFP